MPRVKPRRRCFNLSDSLQKVKSRSFSRLQCGKASEGFSETFTVPTWRIGESMGIIIHTEDGLKHWGVPFPPGLQPPPNTYGNPRWDETRKKMIVLRCSKKIGQTTKNMILFVPNMYVSGKISALRPPPTYTKSEVFWNPNGFRKPSKTARFQDLRVFAGFCGSLAFLRVCFSPGFCVFFP